MTRYRHDATGWTGRCFVVMLLVCALTACLGCGTAQMAPDAPPVDVFAPALGARTIKVMTLNVAHGRKDGRNQILQKTAAIRANLEVIAGVLRREQPDIAALQEADGPSSWSGKFDHVEFIARKAGFPHHFRGEHVKSKLLKLNYGAAILSASPLIDEKSVRFKSSPPTPRKGFVVCSVEWPDSGGVIIDVVSVHLDFLRKDARKKQIAQMTAALAPRKRPMIVMGDFNCEWTSGEPTIRTLAKNLGLRAYKPDSEGLDTFRKLDRRLDWILISPEFEFVAYDVLPDVISDHNAVTAILKLGNPGPEKE